MQGGSRPLATVVRPALALPDLGAWSVAVLVPWLLGRGTLLLVATAAARQRGKTFLAGYAVWDGAWYAQIARDGYGFVSSRGETPWPFFPLFPGVLNVGTRLGVPASVAGLLVNHLALLLAMTGVWAITLRHGSGREAALASWALGLCPGSVALTLLYPDAIFLACGVWAFLALEQRRDATAALLAAGAALVRPNGAVLAASLGTAVLLGGGTIRRAASVVLPAALAVAAWLAYVWSHTGDPLAFVHAKTAWHEVTLGSLLTGTDPLPKLDLAPLLIALLVLALGWRRLPTGWLVFAALALLPSLGLGILGMPRYVSSCFPVFVACGMALARVSRSAATVVLAASALGLLLFGARVLLGVSMP
ncbi:hypothetical protein K2Z84_05540 [Candidatus Binatia bacterium]|jgi:hypothetical protein|nr:hypothetical protein [Candidatus Binatia bacterium]